MNSFLLCKFGAERFALANLWHTLRIYVSALVYSSETSEPWHTEQRSLIGVLEIKPHKQVCRYGKT